MKELTNKVSSSHAPPSSVEGNKQAENSNAQLPSSIEEKRKKRIEKATNNKSKRMTDNSLDKEIRQALQLVDQSKDSDSDNIDEHLQDQTNDEHEPSYYRSYPYNSGSHRVVQQPHYHPQLPYISPPILPSNEQFPQIPQQSLVERDVSQKMDTLISLVKSLTDRVEELEQRPSTLSNGTYIIR